MVFLIQNTQNRDGAAVQLKLEERIRAVKGAVKSLEDMSEEELERLRALYYQLAERAQASLKQGSQKKEAPQVRKDGS